MWKRTWYALSVRSRWVPGEGIGVDIVDVADVQVIGSTAGVGVDEAVWRELFGKRNNSLHVEWLLVEHTPAVTLVEGFDLHNTARQMRTVQATRVVGDQTSEVLAVVPESPA